MGRTGFGIVDWHLEGPRHIYNTCIETPPKMEKRERLKKLHQNLVRLLGRFKPQVAVVEELFFSKNVRTAMSVGEARGVILMALSGRGIELVERGPQVMKKALTADGRASKAQVQTMVSSLLGIGRDWKVDDEADALALALSWRPSQEVLEGKE